MEHWGLTDVGNVRKQNQDYFDVVSLENHGLLAVVCDGMGGAKSGNVASKLATEVFVQSMEQGMRSRMTQEQLEELLRHSVLLANAAVFDQASLGEDFHGMGTTLVATLILDDYALIANVGDSRCYIMDHDGISFVTVDHSLVEMMVRRGDITRDEAMHHPSKNVITRAVGTEQEVKCDIYHHPLKDGDSILLCSDGLSNVVTGQEMLFEVVYGVQKSGCPNRLLKIAKGRGAPDNVTIVLISK